jgi:hypothetical protein
MQRYLGRTVEADWNAARSRADRRVTHHAMIRPWSFAHRTRQRRLQDDRRSTRQADLPAVRVPREQQVETGVGCLPHPMNRAVFRHRPGRSLPWPLAYTEGPQRSLTWTTRPSTREFYRTAYDAEPRRERGERLIEGLGAGGWSLLFSVFGSSAWRVLFLAEPSSTSPPAIIIATLRTISARPVGQALGSAAMLIGVVAAYRQWSAIRRCKASRAAQIALFQSPGRD